MNDSIKDDIGYLRQLAIEGRSAPILGGIFLAGAGTIFGIACFIQWVLVLRGVAGWQPVLALWAGALLLFALVWLLAFLQMRAKGVRAGGTSNRAFHASWLACGIGITVGSIAVGLAGAVTRSPSVMLAYPAMVFAFYGTAWLISGTLAGRRWMHGVAIVAYGFAPVLGLLSGDSALLPAMGTALLLTLTWPGILLMREKAL
jgi:hypothetical protein